ncbi:amino acid ABC transporter permease [Cupriavidus sp. SW-Y-13]|uniref:amino acid ABC transporter permease n=1 Tax=Cupriavidus sp. SW-Y-13 TaxID=2653854 RepID=UPI001366440F|nr:amino acid ABC transporter permease [Cupriavidus sp. SW-Y-13]MWL90018.1 ABC transporter permease subunit [Cupriavidus sp. SW-Y-13]
MNTLDFSFFNWDTFLVFIKKGLFFSVKLTLIAMLCGIALGTVLALMRLSGRRWLERSASAYVNTLRSIPLVMIILWFYLLIPLFVGHPIGAELSAIITYIAFEAAYYSDIMRAGIQSVTRGQINAGYAMGMTYGQCMRLVVLPQAFRAMLPLLLTQTIVLFQETSLVYAIGAYDLLKGFSIVGVNFNRPVETYLIASVTYFCICYSLSLMVKRLQFRLAVVR